MEKSPMVSVLMTLYNRELFVAEAIESVIASTYQNWELIICDDMSNDSSFKIASEFAKKESRIRLYKNKKNLGDYPNRNKAAEYARGKYIKYVDSDDFIYPFGLAILVDSMERFPEAGFGLCSLEQDVARPYPFVLEPAEIYKRNYLEGKSLFHKAPLSSIIKKSAFDEVGGFANVRHYGDFELWHRLSKYYNVVLMPHGIVWYREADGQEAAIRALNPVNKIRTIRAAYKHIISNDIPLNIEDKNSVSQMLETQMSLAIISALKHSTPKKSLEMLKESKLKYSHVFKNFLKTKFTLNK